MKRCTKCGLEKPLEEFYAFNNARKGGDQAKKYRRGDCKSCYTVYIKQYRLDNLDK